MHPVYRVIWKGDPSDLSKGFPLEISGGCSCCRLFPWLAVARAALLPVCFEGDGGTRHALQPYH